MRGRCFVCLAPSLQIAKSNATTQKPLATGCICCPRSFTACRRNCAVSPLVVTALEVPVHCVTTDLPTIHCRMLSGEHPGGEHPGRDKSRHIESTVPLRRAWPRRPQCPSLRILIIDDCIITLKQRHGTMYSNAGSCGAPQEAIDAADTLSWTEEQRAQTLPAAVATSCTLIVIPY